MADAQASLEEIREDIACPACLYNLRGLHGAVIDCPECGHHCDIAKLVARRWTKPWYKAPGFNRVLLPVVWAYLGWMAIMVLSMQRWLDLGGFSISTAVAILTIIAIWCLTMVWAWRLFGDVRGIALPLLAHVIFGAYLVAFFGLISAVISTIVSAMSGENVSAVMSMILAAICMGFFWLARRGERYIAEQCIRRYLAAEPTS